MRIDFRLFFLTSFQKHNEAIFFSCLVLLEEDFNSIQGIRDLRMTPVFAYRRNWPGKCQSPEHQGRPSQHWNQDLQERMSGATISGHC
jgi:hypothetical protein